MRLIMIDDGRTLSKQMFVSFYKLITTNPKTLIFIARYRIDQILLSVANKHQRLGIAMKKVRNYLEFDMQVCNSFMEKLIKNLECQREM